MMKKVILTVAVLASSLSLAACNSYDPGDRAVGGALLGAAGGALVGAAVTGRPGGALAGAAIGGASGAVVGAATTPQPGGCARVGYDYYGNRVCLAYY
jgi:hypothetical protein